MSFNYNIFKKLENHTLGNKCIKLTNASSIFEEQTLAASPRSWEVLNVRKINSGIVKEKDPQYVGIEIELERCQLLGDVGHEVGAFWIAKNDGSLRNDGTEFVSRFGLTAHVSTKATQILEQYIKTNKIPVEVNARTGLHVHMNMGGESYYTLANVLFLYAILEPVFFFVSGNRNNNIFCVPWETNKKNLCDVISDWAEFAKNGRAFGVLFRNYSKYCGLNLASLGSFGTLEFRMHEGTFNSDKIDSWVDSLNRLVSLGKTTDLMTNIMNFRQDRSSHKYVELIWSIFPQYAGKILPALDQLLVDCKTATLHNYRAFVDRECVTVVDELPKITSKHIPLPVGDNLNIDLAVGMVRARDHILNQPPDAGLHIRPDVRPQAVRQPVPQRPRFHNLIIDDVQADVEQALHDPNHF